MPKPNSLADATDKSDANGHSNGNNNTTSISYADSYGHSNSDDASRIAYAYSNRDGDIHAEVNADAKAATYAVSTAYALSVIG